MPEDVLHDTEPGLEPIATAKPVHIRELTVGTPCQVMVVGKLRNSEEGRIVRLIRIDKTFVAALPSWKTTELLASEHGYANRRDSNIWAEARLACTKLGDSFGHLVRRGVMSRNAGCRRTECQAPVSPVKKVVLQPVSTAVPALVLARRHDQ